MKTKDKQRRKERKIMGEKKSGKENIVRDFIN